MPVPACVGALVRDGRHRVFVHRRTANRRLLPGLWDIVGGHLEPGETSAQALARELVEETGWRLRRIEALLADWEWEHHGVVRRERDYLVEVNGDLDAPRLELGKHDAYAWVGRDDLELLMEGRTDGDRRLRDLVAKAVRIRLTARLRLEPLGPEHAGHLWRLHQDEAVAAWHGGRYLPAEAERRAARAGRAWDTAGVGTWMAFDRVSGELVGRGGLSRADADGPARWELGWTVRSDLWGRGYATEIGRAGLAYAFGDLGADEVVARAERHNRRSRAVMERLGMRHVGETAGGGSEAGGDRGHHGGRFIHYTIARATTSGT